MTRQYAANAAKTRTRHGAAAREASAELRKLHRLWIQMRARCSPTASGKSLRNYFQRGIRVCRRWHKFENFTADMGPRPPGHSIDRIDGSRGYSPRNCRWATFTQQARNTRQNRLLPLDGQLVPMVVWAERNKLSYNTVESRLRRGWTLEEILTNPKPHTKNPRARTARGQRSGAYTHPEKIKRGENHPRSKLTWAQVRDIRARLKRGDRRNLIAADFGVSPGTIGFVANGTTWRESC